MRRQNGESNMHLLLAKIGSRMRMQDLCEKGSVFMRRISAFTKMESRVVGAPNEGLFTYYSGRNPSLKVVAKVGDKALPLEIESLRLNSSARHHAVYCMSAIEISSDGGFDIGRSLGPFIRDRRLLEFGDTLVVFKNAPEFVRRLERAANDAGHDLDQDRGLVEYVLPDHCGEMGPFRKIGEYGYQREFRFITKEPIPEDSITLSLGCLLDIAGWLDLSKVDGSAA